MAWTAPRTWVTSEIVTAALMNTHVRDNLSYLKTEADKLGFAFVDYTGSGRVLETIYQNGANPRLIAVSGINKANAGAIVYAKIGSANPPTTILPGSYGEVYVSASTDIRGITFLVPPNWYYQVFESDNITIERWAEWG